MENDKAKKTRYEDLRKEEKGSNTSDNVDKGDKSHKNVPEIHATHVLGDDSVMFGLSTAGKRPPMTMGKC